MIAVLDNKYRPIFENSTVKCVTPLDGYTTAGKKYDVFGVLPKDGRIVITDDHGKECWVNANRFELSYREIRSTPISDADYEEMALNSLEYQRVNDLVQDMICGTPEQAHNFMSLKLSWLNDKSINEILSLNDDDSFPVEEMIKRIAKRIDPFEHKR